MIEWRKISLTQEQLDELELAEKTINKPQLLIRLQCIKFKNKWLKHREIADLLWITIETITGYIKKYYEWWIIKLLSWNYTWKISVLTIENQEKLKEANSKKPFNTASEVKKYIKDNFWFDFHLHYIQKLLKKNFDFRTRKSN